jgi:hypothetical protein
MLTSVDPTPEELERKARLRARYVNDPVLRLLADEIHTTRMMPLPACDQCIEIAAERIDKSHD